MGYKKSNSIAIGGLITAIIIILLYSGSIIKNNKLFFMAFSTYILVLPYIKGGYKTGILVYLSSTILSFILVPNKFYVIVYGIFGYYTFVKMFSEKKKILTGYMIKYLWYNFSLIIAYVLLKNFIVINGFLKEDIGKVLLIAILEVGFFVYDYIYTRFISYVFNRLYRI